MHSKSLRKHQINTNMTNKNQLKNTAQHSASHPRSRKRSTATQVFLNHDSNSVKSIPLSWLSSCLVNSLVASASRISCGTGSPPGWKLFQTHSARSSTSAPSSTPLLLRSKVLNLSLASEITSATTSTEMLRISHRSGFSLSTETD